MGELKVITNNVPRDIIDAWQLTEAEQKEFDYLDWKAIKNGNDSASFFRYRNELYDLGEFMAVGNGEFPGRWSEYQSDSYFSGVLVRYVNDFEQVIVGRYYS
jgi:hypothetical protein